MGKEIFVLTEQQANARRIMDLGFSRGVDCEDVRKMLDLLNQGGYLGSSTNPDLVEELTAKHQKTEATKAR